MEPGTGEKIREITAHHGPRANSQNKILTAQDIFIEVTTRFRVSLAPNEQKVFRTFESPKLMVEEMRKDVKRYQNSRKLSLLCKKIEKFSTAWAPFFEIIGILIQSNPEFAAIAWGAVRLVFLVRKRFHSYQRTCVDRE
jgi:hypothetical protein